MEVSVLQLTANKIPPEPRNTVQLKLQINLFNRNFTINYFNDLQLYCMELVKDRKQENDS